jgi:hypothetical protein
VTTETGAALLLATDELDDLAICDRVIVLVRGEHFTEFTEPPFNREALIAATEGITRDPAGNGTSNGSSGTGAEPADDGPADDGPAGAGPAGAGPAGAGPADGPASRTDTQPDSGRQGPP